MADKRCLLSLFKRFIFSLLSLMKWLLFGGGGEGGEETQPNGKKLRPGKGGGNSRMSPSVYTPDGGM